MRLLTLVKSELSFDIGLITVKVNIELSGKEIKKYPQKVLQNHYLLDGLSRIDNWDFTLFAICETLNQLKERKAF